MISKEDLENYIQYRLDSNKKVWEADLRGTDNESVKYYLNRNQHQRENADELEKILIAHDAHAIVDLIARKRDRAFINGKMPTSVLDVKMDDPAIDKLLRSSYPEVERDEFVQMIYESYGFTEQLPTMREVKLLQSKVARMEEIGDFESDEYKSLKKELDLKQCALGIGNIDGGLPYRFSTDILTQSLGKETIEQQKDTQAKDTLSSQIDTRTQDSIEK